MSCGLNTNKLYINIPKYVLYLSATTAAVEGKMGKGLKKLLKKIVAKDAHEQLAVSDSKLAGTIKVRIAEVLFLFVKKLTI